MSVEKKGSGGYNPPRLTSEEFQSQQDFFFCQVERFKKLFEDSTLAKYIIMAGVSGLVVAIIEVLRLLWSAARWVWKF